MLKYTLAIKSDEADLLRNLIHSLGSKEGFTTVSEPTPKRGAYRLLICKVDKEPLVRFDCAPAPDKEYTLEFELLNDEPQAQDLLVNLTEFVSQWYTEMRKSFFR